MKYYLAGPFWDKECSKFFDEFIKRCNETWITNNGEISSYSKVEDVFSSYDKVFVPSHFKIDFNKIKSEYDPCSFRRVLRQILDLDLENLDDGLVVYPKGYDLGTMFELGYFLGTHMDCGKMNSYNTLRRNLIIKDPDKKLIECIDKILSSNFYKDLFESFDCNFNYPKIIISDKDQINLNGFLGSDGRTKFNVVALNVDNYMESPFNSILAGVLYRFKLPFLTYSTSNFDSNVMMLASSLAHIKIDPLVDDLGKVIESKFSDLFWDDSQFDRFKDIK